MNYAVIIMGIFFCVFGLVGIKRKNTNKEPGFRFLPLKGRTAVIFCIGFIVFGIVMILLGLCTVYNNSGLLLHDFQ